MRTRNTIDTFAKTYQPQPYELLAIGIIKQAADDYREVYQREYYWYRYRQSKFAKIHFPEYVNTKEIEEFLFSTWFQTLTALDPTYLKEALVKEIKKPVERWKG